MLTLFNLTNLYNMKRLNLILLFIIGLCMVATISCKKEKDGEPDLKPQLVGKYKMNLSQGAQVQPAVAELKASGTFTIDAGEGDGSPELVGTWDANGNKFIGKIAFEGNPARIVFDGLVDITTKTIDGTFRDSVNLQNSGNFTMTKKTNPTPR